MSEALPNIPEEIILEILSRLPLNSLSRFTCVSKQWLSLISNISPTKTGRQMLLVSSPNSLHSIDLEQEADHHPERVNGFSHKIFPDDHHIVSVLGSCKGLLLMGIDDDFFLWNPITRYLKKVLTYNGMIFKNYVVSGLCYDSSTDENKAVMAFHEFGDSPRYGSEFAMIGSFRNKSWTHICFPYNVTLVSPGPIVNENLHWFVSAVDSDQSHIVVYFNPQIGKFEKLAMPHPGDVISGLGALDGWLCIFRWENPSDIKSSNIEVLVMKEYGMEQSWTSMFIISNLTPLGGDARPLGYTNNCEALALIQTYQSKDTLYSLRVYNCNDNSTQDISIPTRGDFCNYYVHAAIYVESLVKPVDYNWEEEERRGEATYVEYTLNGSPKKMMKVSHDYWLEERIYKQREEEFKSEWGEEGYEEPGSNEFELVSEEEY